MPHPLARNSGFDLQNLGDILEDPGKLYLLILCYYKRMVNMADLLDPAAMKPSGFVPYERITVQNFRNAIDGKGTEDIERQLSYLGGCGLIENGDGTGNYTLSDMGRTVAYNLAEYDIQVRRGLIDSIIHYVSGKGIRIGPRILDVGCGAGQSLHRFSDIEGSSCVGADISEQCISFGNLLRDYYGKSNIRLVKSGAATLPFENDSFDLVFFKNTIRYLDRKKFVREVNRVLSDGGYVMGLGEGCHYHLMNLLYSVRRRALPAGPLYSLFNGMAVRLFDKQFCVRGRPDAVETAAELKRLLTGNGFSVVSIGGSPSPLSLKGAYFFVAEKIC